MLERLMVVIVHLAQQKASMLVLPLPIPPIVKGLQLFLD